MSRHRWIALAALALAPLAAAATGCGDAKKARVLYLFHTNDEHSHILGESPELDDWPAPTEAGTGTIEGGIARRAALLAKEREAATMAGADTLTVSAGDNAMGTLMQVPYAQSAPDMRLMKQLGYDVTTLGNHEFDFGPKALAAAYTTAAANGGAIPTVASTIQFSSTDPGDDDLAALFDESGTDAGKPIHRSLVVTTKSGLKVGFLGTLGAVAATYAPLKKPVTFALPAGAAETDYAAVKQKIWADLQALVDGLRTTQKVDLVVLLSHSGVDTADMTKGEDDETARNVSGIDVIVSGHTHTEFPAVLVTNPKTMKPVLIQQAGSYGHLLGKIKVEVAPDGKVTMDTAAAKLLKVDDTIVATDAQVNTLVENVIKDLEGNRVFSGKSFLEATLSRIEGAPVTDDANTVGDLYFRKLGKTGFDVVAMKSFVETPMLNLTSDAELAYGLELGIPAEIGVMAAGVIRADLKKGKSGDVAFTDVFRVLPLGISPVDGSVGYPMVAFRILPIYLKAALELTAGYAYTNEDASTNFLVPSGFKVEYDTSRPMFNPDPSVALDPTNGRIKKMSIANDPRDPDGASTLIYDADTGGWKGIGPLGPRSFVVVTSYYIASFAKQNGVTLLDVTTSEMITPEQAIVKRTDGSEVKEWEALSWYVKRETTANGGTLPARYDRAQTTYPRRMICAGPLCKPL